MHPLKRRWLWQAPLGLVLVGAGLSMVADAAMYRAGGADVWSWVLYGTAALTVFNSGLCVFGDSILVRMRYEKTRDS